MRTTSLAVTVALMVWAFSARVAAQGTTAEPAADAGIQPSEQAAVDTAKEADAKEDRPALKISGDFKIRGEDRRNASFDPRVRDKEGFVGQLTRVKLSGTVEGVDYVVHLMDDREWGSERKTGTSESTSLLEGYLQVGGGFDLRVGRQEITLGKKRLIGSTGWDYKRLAAYDGVRFMTRRGHHGIDLFAVKVAEAETSLSDDTHLLAASYTWDAQKRWTPGFYALYNQRGDDPETEAAEETRMPIGGAIGSLGLFSGLGGDYEIIYQWGTRAGLDHRAHLYHVGLQYTQPEAGRFWLGVEYNLASGDRDPDDSENNTFDKLYSINHSHYGYIDYQDPANMRNLRLTAGAKVVSKVSAQADYHVFRLDQARDRWYSRLADVSLRDPSGQSGKDVGSEIDLVATADLPGKLKLEVGYCRFFAGEFVKRLQGEDAPDSSWGYVQLKARF